MANEYQVSIVFTVTVTADSEEQAEEAAKDAVTSGWYEDYSVEYTLDLGPEQE